MRSVITFVVTIVTTFTLAQNPNTIFTKEFETEQLQADFNLFRLALEKIHPGLYRYNTQAQMDSIFNSVARSIANPMSFREFYKLLAGINAQVRCQHTAIAPRQKHMEDIEKYAKMFPYEIMWNFNPLKAYAFSDLTLPNEGGIKPATEILSINGRPVKAVYDTLIKYLFADGYNVTSKRVRMVPMDFQHWYYLLIDRPETFTMEFLIDGRSVTKSVHAITIDEYRQSVKRYIKSKDPDVRRLVTHYRPTWKLRPYRLEFAKGSIAILTLKEFGPLDFIHESFESIKKKEIKNLIIDVRDNPGGWDNQGFTLFSYLINKPTYYYDSIYSTASDINFLLRHTEKDTAWWETTEPLLEKHGSRLGISRTPENGFLQQPQKNRFSGKVYVLMNGKSMSTTAEFTAAAHYNKLATFIGEESGGAYCGGNGGDFATVMLPYTGLSLHLPLSKYVMAISSSLCNGQGTIPHYQISKTTKDWMDLRDPQMEFALDLIVKEKP